MASVALPSKTPRLTRNLGLGITPASILLAGMVLLSLVLHLVDIGAIGDGNAYYTAAVESILQSWNNFFFVAAEPGGSVSVDKPPLGLWIEAASAFALGVSGFSVTLPNIVAGVLSVPLLYHLVKIHIGASAGLVAALMMTTTPIFVATNRNNTMDGMLVFVLLLAAWAFIEATESGKARWLFLGAFIVGLAFNIKMLQAFLPLPAFYALYLFGAKGGWLRKMINLGVATIILVGVSLSWAIIVDLTPADQRPYVGSSENNTVMELILGHNGAARLYGRRFAGSSPDATPAYVQVPGANPGGQVLQPPAALAPDGQSPAQGFQPLPGAPSGGQPPTQGLSNGRIPQQGPPQLAVHACADATPGAPCSFDLPNGNIGGTCLAPPKSGQLVCVPQPRPAAQNGRPGRPGSPVAGTPFNDETGSPGVFRFFQPPLSKQMSWLLPFALISLILAVFAAPLRLPLEGGAHKSLILWGGWLLTCLVFFSCVGGIFHAYYVIMLAPPLGALVGSGITQLWAVQARRARVGWLLLGAASALTITFEIHTALQYGGQALWMPLAVILLLGGLTAIPLKEWRPIGYLAILSAMLTIPFAWTLLTVSAANPNVNLPTAYGGSLPQAYGPGAGLPPPVGGTAGKNGSQQDALLDYLLANTQNVEYLVAVPSAQIGAPLVLATGRPVLYIGGFTGSDPVVDAKELAEMVANSGLRYVLYSDESGDDSDIAAWLATSCTVVSGFNQGQSAPNHPPPTAPGRGARPDGQRMALYMCE